MRMHPSCEDIASGPCLVLPSHLAVGDQDVTGMTAPGVAAQLVEFPRLLERLGSMGVGPAEIVPLGPGGGRLQVDNSVVAPPMIVASHPRQLKELALIPAIMKPVGQGVSVPRWHSRTCP